VLFAYIYVALTEDSEEQKAKKRQWL
jgi:hypothetical protein